MFSNFRDQRASRRYFEGCEGAFLVSAHQPAVAGDVGREDGGQPPFDPRLGHKIALPTRFQNGAYGREWGVSIEQQCPLMGQHGRGLAAKKMRDLERDQRSKKKAPDGHAATHHGALSFSPIIIPSRTQARLSPSSQASREAAASGLVIRLRGGGRRSNSLGRSTSRASFISPWPDLDTTGPNGRI